MSADLEENTPEQVEETPAVETPAAPVVAQAPVEVPIDNASPAQAEAPVAQAPVEKSPEQHAAELTQQNVMFGQDLSNGHIQPKTYKDLWENKGTLGKVGTLFGLLVSGAGAGLTHQPNAVLQMMDKQIANDLEAQKTNQGNKQNWYKLSLEQSRNEAVNSLTASETFKNLNENEKQEFINANMGIVEGDAKLNAKNMMMVNYLHEQQNAINKLPPGPQRDATQQFLNSTVVPAAMKHIFDNNLQIAKGRKDLVQNVPAANESKKGGADNGPIDQKAYQDMVTKGELFSKSGYVDPNKGIDPADNGTVQKAITDVKVNWSNYKDVMDAANALATMERFGQTPLKGVAEVSKKVPWVGEALAAGIDYAHGTVNRPRDILVDALSSRLAGSGASDKTIGDMKKALTPNMFDNAKTVKSLEETIHQHFAHNDKELNGVFTKYPKIKKALPKLRIDYDKSVAKNGPKASDTNVAGTNEEPGLGEKLLGYFKGITSPTSTAKEKEK